MGNSWIQQQNNQAKQSDSALRRFDGAVTALEQFFWPRLTKKSASLPGFPRFCQDNNTTIGRPKTLSIRK